MSFANKFTSGDSASKWFNANPGASLVTQSNALKNIQAARSETEHKQDKGKLGGLAALFFLICTIIGVLVISWYSGSSGGSLDGSFGNHCLAATEGSSAEGNISGSSFNVSFNSSNFNDNQKHACNRRDRREGFLCRNNNVGQGGGFGAMGAGANIERQAKVEADRARLAGRDFYQYKTGENKKVDFSSFAEKTPEAQKKMKAAVQKMKKDATCKMNDISKASQSVKDKLNANKNSVLGMAQSAGVGAESYIASGLMINSFLGCDKEPVNYASQYQPQEALQQLTNSPSMLSTAGIIKTNNQINLVNGVENFSRRSANNAPFRPTGLTGEVGMNQVNNMQLQAGQSPNGAAFRGMLNKGVTGNGRGGAWNQRQNTAYSSPQAATGASISNWGRFNNADCVSPKAASAPAPTQAASSFALKKKQ